MIDAGKLTERITIQKRDVTYEKGIKKETWNYHYSCWSELLDLIGTEKYSAYQAKLENSIKFKCRYCGELKPLIGNTKEYRVIWNEETYNLIFVDSMGNSKTERILQVNKVS